MECWMRISVPDRTGALGAVAAALAGAGADIRSLDVVSVEDGIAVDDLVIEVPGPVEDVRRAVEAIEGVIVEVLRPVPRLPSAASPLEVAARLAERPADEVLACFVEEVPRALHGAWCAIVRARAPRPEVVAASVGAPSFATLEAPWLPLTAPRRLEAALWMPRTWREGHPQHTLAAVPLGSPDQAVLLARRHGPRFHTAELADLARLARLAAARTAEAALV
jgi:hypothetical protein